MKVKVPCPVCVHGYITVNRDQDTEFVDCPYCGGSEFIDAEAVDRSPLPGPYDGGDGL